MNLDCKNYIGKKVVIHAYKYNGWLYRAWEFPIVIEDTDDYIVLCNKGGLILTSEYQTKRVFKSQFDDFRVWIFFKNEWFNLYIYCKNNRLTYYINVSSKFLLEESCFKYIDFDLDFKIFANNRWTELDINEFNQNAIKFRYSEKLINIIKQVEERVIQLINNRYFIDTFNRIKIDEWYNKYKELLFKKKMDRYKNNNEEQ